MPRRAPAGLTSIFGVGTYAFPGPDGPPRPEWITKGLKGLAKGKGKFKGKEHGAGRIRGWKTCTHTAAGVLICKRFNDARGFAQACPNGSAHCCDVNMWSRAPCSRRDHGRQTHNPQAHGTPSSLRAAPGAPGTLSLMNQ